MIDFSNEEYVHRMAINMLPNIKTTQSYCEDCAKARITTKSRLSHGQIYKRQGISKNTRQHWRKFYRFTIFQIKGLFTMLEYINL